MNFSFIDIISLPSGRQRVLAIHMSIFRVVRTKIQILLKYSLISPQFNFKFAAI
jgi:hypothetical protein